MARELGDVFHYFIGEPGEQRCSGTAPILALPIGERDVVRSAFVWNLAVELARAGAAATLVASGDPDSAAGWPDPAAGTLGAAFVPTAADDLSALTETVRQAALGRSEHELVLVQLPPSWLDKASDGDLLLRWTLLFATPESRELERTYELARRILAAGPGARVGVTVHGVRDIEEARDVFLRLADATERHLGRGLVSYGLLLDDLDVYRTVVERRAIGVTRPQSRAARALRDVARLLREDAEAGHG